MKDYILKDTLVKIENISLKFGEKLILRDINAEVKDIVRPGCTQGQIIGILGPSGVGKSMMSRILCGLQTPNTGTITVNNKPVQPGVVGMIAQNYPLFRHRTVLGNLTLAAKKSNSVSKIQEYLHHFELEDRATYYPAQLSGGQRQRVAIIQQLLCSEHFIVMDEPFTGLDPLMKDRVCELILKIANLHEENTLFIVAHDIPAVVSVCDRLWLFGRDRNDKGEIIPGSKIQAEYDLVERELAWEPGIQSTAKYVDFVNEIKDRFSTL
jgi:ABC-type nitrate/sulfonate/bicarbonate transport system ATPase subunit